MACQKPAMMLLPLWFGFLLVASPAQAVTIAFGGAGDPSLHGTTGSLAINEISTGTYDVVWSMDFDGYEGSVGNHQYLTNIAFKAFSSISAVTIDSIDWVPATAGIGGVYPSNVNDNGCVDGSTAGMVCIGLNPVVDATMGGVIHANFTVAGALMLDEWSYRGKYGNESGWVISESAPAAPIPEPGAAMVFGASLLIVGLRLRGSARSRRAGDDCRC